MLRLFRNPAKPSSSNTMDVLDDCYTSGETGESVSTYSEQSIEISKNPILTRVSSSASEASTNTTRSHNTTMSHHSHISTSKSCEEDNAEGDNAEEDYEDTLRAADYDKGMVQFNQSIEYLRLCRQRQRDMRVDSTLVVQDQSFGDEETVSVEMTSAESKEVKIDSTLVVQDQSSREVAKLSLMLDNAGHLARVEDNAIFKTFFRLAMSLQSVLSTPSACNSGASSCEEAYAEDDNEEEYNAEDDNEEEDSEEKDDEEEDNEEEDNAEDDHEEQDDNATYEQDQDEDNSQATDYDIRDDSTLVVQDQSSSEMGKLSFMLDDVRRLARVGDNAICKTIYKLAKGVSKSDIHVLTTDMDERARGKSKSRKLEESVQTAITEDLRMVYSASAQDAKFILATVIVLFTDGSLSRTLWDSEGVAGLAEIGLVWRLFEADNLKVYGGGLVVKKKDVGYGIWDVFANKGQACLLESLVPRVANGIMSRIGDSNSDLLVEI